MFSLSSTTATSSFGSVIAPAPARDVGTLNRQLVEQEARFRRAQVIGEFVGSGIASLWSQVRRLTRRRAAIAELSALDDRMLADIGLSRSQIRSAVDSAAGFGPELVAGPGLTSSFNDNYGVRAA